MTQKQFLNLILIGFILTSCNDITNRKDGDWDDVIKLSKKTAEFNAAGDSVTIKTGGDWWWIIDISVNEVNCSDFSNIDLQSNAYIINRDSFCVERRDKNTLFIKADSNKLNINRIISIGLEAGDYFDRVTITQKCR